MNLTEISFSKVKFQIESFLTQQYAKANILYSSASPFGQILMVLENLNQLSLLYLKNSMNQFDLSDANSLNYKIIRSAAIFAGHIPGRNISSSGTLKLTLKTSADVSTSVPGGRITITNRGGLKNKTNGLNYSVNIGGDARTYKLSNNSQFYIPIIQGKWDFKTFTGTGQENQTYSASLRGNQDIENFNYEVLVDGTYWTVKTSLYDLLPNENSCVVRTGFNGGCDIIFGNGGFGAIPNINSIIKFSYLISEGSIGSIFRRTINDWTFVDPVLDGFGNTLDISKTFDVEIYTDINFGADAENIDFTKNILPIVSNNFVLGLPQQYAYQIKKLGVFSHVNAYDSNGTIFIVVTPNIVLFKNQNANYFTIDIAAFSIDDYESSKIDTYLQSGGNIQLTKRYIITSPVLSYYVMNVFIITYSDSQDDSVFAQIHDVISQYFLYLTRIDVIPKVDLIKVISSITDISSVDVSFICKKNEDYHTSMKQQDQNRRNQYASNMNLKLSLPNPTHNKNATLGLDPVLGDINFDSNELPIIRGGWSDRNGTYYSDNMDDSGLKSVNIIKKGTIDSSHRSKV